MRYKVTFEFGDDPIETLEYSKEEAARRDVAILTARYARENGSCHTQMFDGDQLLMDITETYYG